MQHVKIDTLLLLLTAVYFTLSAQITDTATMPPTPESATTATKETTTQTPDSPSPAPHSNPEKQVPTNPELQTAIQKQNIALEQVNQEFEQAKQAAEQAYQQAPQEDKESGSAAKTRIIALTQAHYNKQMATMKTYYEATVTRFARQYITSIQKLQESPASEFLVTTNQAAPNSPSTVATSNTAVPVNTATTPQTAV